MGTGAKLLTILALFTLLTATAADKEPSYNGRSLSDWLHDLDPHLIYEVNHPPPEIVAIQQMGTNALPLLLKWMAAKDPREDPKPNLADCFNMTRSERAAMALSILGETASPAIPELTRLALNLRNRERYDRCITALAATGLQSLPSLEAIIKDGTAGQKCSAIESLSGFHTNVAALLPTLIHCLVGKNEDVGWSAADSLSRLEIPSTALVQALTNSLSTASAPARARIFRCLCWLGNEAAWSSNQAARDAVPAIRAGLSDPSSEVRTNAIYAAQRIAPELLTKADSK